MTFRRAALLVGVLAALAPAGCGQAPTGGGVASVADTVRPSSGASPSVSPSASPDPLAFARCMRENGIDMADPEPGGPARIHVRGKDKGAVEKAHKACSKYMGGGEGKARVDPEAHDRLLAFARCMREHGVDMADPVPGDGRVMIKRPEGGEAASEKAHKACEHHLPGRPGGGPGGPEGSEGSEGSGDGAG
ncbi:hypothetical protein ACIBCT_25865 [Streptosporangium sp. NPDC050855]|uniref:hypothetical protein n=1 Tax=Streptosporangium sp. NPDC050855 TaxID=3366194 RepID=UPI0037A9F2DC